MNPLDPTPRYLQLAALLRGQIEAGEFEPGDRLPSEPTLVQRYGLARATVNKAYQLLAEEGLVVAIPGIGWHVAASAEPGNGAEPIVRDGED